MKEVLTKNLNVLKLDGDIIKKLNVFDINKVYELCALNRKLLKSYGLTLNEINEIIVKLQLSGLDLSKKYKI